MYEIRQINKPSSIPTLLHSIEHWVGYIEHYSRRWWAAFDGQEWVGWAGLQIFNPTTVLLTPCEVMLEARGHGLQKRFIQEREQWAITNGFEVALSLANYDNIISANNLIKSGYLLRDPWPGAAGMGLYFQKGLKNGV